LDSTCELSPSQAEALRLCNFSYFAAVMVPLAERRRFQAICDWGNWIFPFDDLFDNGSLRNDSEQAQAVVRRLLATFKASHERCLNEDLEDGAMRNMVDFHTTIWNAIRSDSSQGEPQLCPRPCPPLLFLTGQASKCDTPAPWSNTASAPSTKYTVRPSNETPVSMRFSTKGVIPYVLRHCSP